MRSLPILGMLLHLASLLFRLVPFPPMLSIILFPAAYRIPVTVFVVGLSLIFTGYTSAKLGKAPTEPAMLRNLIIGLLTMGVTYFFGQLFSILKAETSVSAFSYASNKACACFSSPATASSRQ